MKNKKELLSKFIEKENKPFICKRPFELVEVDLEGNLYFCFPRCNNKSYPVGNLYKNSFEEICLSKKAIEFKKDILNSEYKFCDFSNCVAPNKSLQLTNTNEKDLLGIVYPKELRLHIDNICNIRCIICRDKHITKFEKEEDFLNIVLPRIISMCRNAEIVFMNGFGEVFFSEMAKKLILALTEKYKNLKFDFCTNGINANEKYIKEYNLEGRIQNLSISMHAIKKETYEKILLGSNYEKLMRNMQYIKSLLDKQEIKSVAINFVVNKYNYKEMTEFQEYGNKNNFTCFYSSLQDSGIFGNQYEKLALKNTKTKDYKKLCKILGNTIFDKNCIFDNNLANIRNHLKLNNQKQFRTRLKEYLNQIKKKLRY